MTGSNTVRSPVFCGLTPRRGPMLALTLTTWVGFGCSSSTEPPPVLEPAAIELTVTTDVFRSIGEEMTAHARVVDPTGEPVPRAVSWVSADPSVVTVTNGGVVRAVGNGSADVTARLGTLSNSVTLTVAQQATSLQVSGADTVFNPGVRTRLAVVATDALGSPYQLDPIVFETDAPDVVVVEGGHALPVGEGTAELTVRAGDLSTTHRLTVVPEIELEVPRDLAEALQWAFEDSAAANGALGGSAAISIPGVGLWKGVLGRSEGTQRIRPDMLFYPGSIKKSISSAVLLSLADDGIVSLQDTLGHWLEPFDNPNIPTGVTIQQLLQNTSGIYSYASHPTLGDSVFADPDRVWTPRELMEKFMLEPEFPPGTSWKSSNAGYVLAGMMAEAATGRSMPSLIRERVLDPLGMTESAVLFFEEPTSPVAATWRGEGGQPLVSSADLQTPSSHTVLWPQTVVSAESLLRFVDGLFGDFLGEPTRTAMLTAIPDDGRIPGQVGAGIGIRKYNYLGRTQWGHSGSQGAGSGFVIWDEASGIVVSVLYNQNGASHFASHFRLVPELLRIALAAQ